jgi:hypothetical protein
MEPLFMIWLPVAVTAATAWRVYRPRRAEGDPALRALGRVVRVAPLVSPAAVRVVPRPTPALHLVRNDDVA